MTEPDVQLLGTELLCAEIIKPGRSSRVEFASWLGAVSETELVDMLVNRKRIRENAQSELDDFRAVEKAAKERKELAITKYNDQMKTARETRSVIFNSQTGKMEVIKK